VAAAVRESGDAELKLFWGSTLHHMADLPFQLPAMPTTYGGFRERMHGVKIRPTVSRAVAWSEGGGVRQTVSPGVLHCV
jgi:hypothetical protein